MQSIREGTHIQSQSYLTLRLPLQSQPSRVWDEKEQEGRRAMAMDGPLFLPLLGYLTYPRSTARGSQGSALVMTKDGNRIPLYPH